MSDLLPIGSTPPPLLLAMNTDIAPDADEIVQWPPSGHRSCVREGFGISHLAIAGRMSILTFHIRATARKERDGNTTVSSVDGDHNVSTGKCRHDKCPG